MTAARLNHGLYLFPCPTKRYCTLMCLNEHKALDDHFVSKNCSHNLMAAKSDVRGGRQQQDLLLRSEPEYA